MVYLDASAIVKLVKVEPESAALRRMLATETEHVSSALARVEVLRAMRRIGAGQENLRTARSVLDRIALIAMDEPLLRAASELGLAGLRSLAAIHLATALSLPVRAPVVTYDLRLSDSAKAAGLRVVAPR